MKFALLRGNESKQPNSCGTWPIISSVKIQGSFIDRVTGEGHLRSCEFISSLLPINHDTMVLKTCKRYQTVRLIKTRRLPCIMTNIPAPYWVMTWPRHEVKFKLTYDVSHGREKHNGANPTSLPFLVQKLYRLQFWRHFIFDDLWWPQYWPDPKMFL